MAFYIARDKDGRLGFFVVKPLRGEGMYMPDEWIPRSPAELKTYIESDHPEGVGLTWEDEPRGVDIKAL